jgi:hypothetical protein
LSPFELNSDDSRTRKIRRCSIISPVRLLYKVIVAVLPFFILLGARLSKWAKLDEIEDDSSFIHSDFHNYWFSQRRVILKALVIIGGLKN